MAKSSSPLPAEQFTGSGVMLIAIMLLSGAPEFKIYGVLAGAVSLVIGLVMYFAMRKAALLEKAKGTSQP